MMRNQTEFSNVFKALGVSFNLTSTEHGRVMLSNTASRIAELVQTISEILESNSLPRAAALRLRGRMQFCDSWLPFRQGVAPLSSGSYEARLRREWPVSA